LRSCHSHLAAQLGIIEPVRNCGDPDVGVDNAEAPRRHICLRLPDIVGPVEYLPAEIGRIDRVEVAEHDVADAAGRQVTRRGTTDAAHADQQGGAGADALLPVSANLR
jgi:hypothetical protein